MMKMLQQQFTQSELSMHWGC